MNGRRAGLARRLRDVDDLGPALLSGEIYDEATIMLDADGDELTVTWRNPEAAAPEAVGAAAR